jgi:hypothetical protein
MNTVWPSSLGKYELQVMLAWDRVSGTSEPPDFAAIREAYEDHLAPADFIARYQNDLRWGVRSAACHNTEAPPDEDFAFSLPGLSLDS